MEEIATRICEHLANPGSMETASEATISEAEESEGDDINQTIRQMNIHSEERSTRSAMARQTNYIFARNSSRTTVQEPPKFMLNFNDT